MNDAPAPQGSPDPVYAKEGASAYPHRGTPPVGYPRGGDTTVVDVGGPRVTTVRLVPTSQDAPCHFWIGLAPTGTQRPSDLMDQSDVGLLLAEAATKGVAENGPVMLSDTEAQPPRYVYLLPVPQPGFRERALWIDDLAHSLASWAPKAVGLYIAPELVKSGEAPELLLSILTALIAVAPTQEYYLLTGGYGLNAILNVALRLKSDLDGDSVRLAIYH